MKHINRPEQSKFLLQLIKAMVILVVLFNTQNHVVASGGVSSKFGGVQLGTITYSYRSMPDQSIQSILDYVVHSGLSSVELMGDPVEQYAGIPQTKDSGVINRWRSGVSMDKFKEIRKIFNARGVKINILKLGDPKWSDKEIDYAFNVCKVLGAKGITMEISEEAAKRMEPFAEKHNLYVIFHNHTQPGDPNFSFDRILAFGPKLMLNLDAGHYYGVTGIDPCKLIDRLHDRIVSIHIKDKTGPHATEPNMNQPFGQGQTPVVEILQLIQKNKWPITCDIELEYAIPEGSDALKEVVKCVEYCRSALLPRK